MKKPKLLSGKELALKIEEKLKAQVFKLKARGIIPTLAAILVGEDIPSQIYIGVKSRAAKRVGIDFLFYQLPDDLKEKDLLYLIKELNRDKTVHGILVQLPLPSHINTDKTIAQISTAKDIDGLKKQSPFPPPAASAILRLLKHFKIRTRGKKVVIVGSGRLVGKPLLKLLRRTPRSPERSRGGEGGQACQVTALHQRTRNLPQKIKSAEILVSATGVPHLITPDLVNPKMVVVDMGGTKDTQGRLLGDVNFEKVSKIVKAITPVPGGVGPLTVVILLENLVLACQKQKSHS